MKLAKTPDDWEQEISKVKEALEEAIPENISFPILLIALAELHSETTALWFLGSAEDDDE